MKTINKILIVIVLLFVTNSAFSQRAGYMGKRFVINADLNASTAWSRPNAYGHHGYFSFNYILSPSIEFIATRRFAIGATYLYTPGMFEFRAANDQHDYINGVYHPYDAATADNKFTSHGVGIYSKFYIGDGTAPIGPYIKTELDWFFYNYTINSMSGIPNFANADYVNGTTGKGNLGGFKIEFGRDFLFFNRLRVTTALSVGIPFGGYRTLSIGWNEKFKIIPYLKAGERRAVGSTYNDATEQDFVNTQIFCQYLICLKIGIGLLAF